MIIKCSRVRARGPALKRLIAHVESAEDNEQVIAISGNFADLWDARRDARQFGREYAVAHWILSPKSLTTDEQMAVAVERLAEEFGFDLSRAVVRGHKKSKADESLFDRHVHVLAPMVDPNGTVLPLSHDRPRNEKLSRIFEYDFGGWADPATRSPDLEPFTRGAHLKAVIAELTNSDRKDVARALKIAFPDDTPRPVESFDTASAQRLKREGFDLPALRLIVCAAWDAAVDRSTFATKLSQHGLVVIKGEKPGIYLVTTSAGEQVGALGRLIKVKKADVLAKMEVQDAGPEEAHVSGSNLPEYPAAREDAGAAEAAGGPSAEQPPNESDWDDAGYDQQVAGDRSADDRKAGQDHRIVERPRDRTGGPGYAEDLIPACDFAFALGLSACAPRLSDMLAVATRNSLPQTERVVLELGEIEDEARLAKLMIITPPPEPASLADARSFFVASQQAVLDRQSAADLAAAVVTELQQSRPWWRRAVGFITGANVRHRANVRTAILAKDKAQLSVKQALKNQLSEENRLNLAVALHKDAVREHVETWTKRAADADARITAVKAANEMWARLPGASAVGAAGLYRLGVKVSGRKRSRRHAPRGSGEPDFSGRP